MAHKLGRGASGRNWMHPFLLISWSCSLFLFLGIEEGDLATGISLRGVVSLRTAIGQKLHGSGR